MYIYVYIYRGFFMWLTIDTECMIFFEHEYWDLLLLFKFNVILLSITFFVLLCFICVLVALAGMCMMM